MSPESHLKRFRGSLRLTVKAFVPAVKSGNMIVRFRFFQHSTLLSSK